MGVETFQNKVTEYGMFRSRLPLPAPVTGEAAGVTRPCHDIHRVVLGEH